MGDLLHDPRKKKALNQAQACSASTDNGKDLRPRFRFPTAVVKSRTPCYPILTATLTRHNSNSPLPAKNLNWFFTFNSPSPEASLQASSSSQSPLSAPSSSSRRSRFFRREADVPLSSWKETRQEGTASEKDRKPLLCSEPVRGVRFWTLLGLFSPERVSEHQGGFQFYFSFLFIAPRLYYFNSKRWMYPTQLPPPICPITTAL